jgi:hypothetical protein
MPRQKRKPPDLGLSIEVRHPASEVIDPTKKGQRPFNEEKYAHKLDADGHHIRFDMVEMPSQRLLELSIRRGLDAASASDLLRKLADHIDRHGSKLLNLTYREGGFIDRDGDLDDDDFFRMKHDNCGNLAEPLPPLAP